MTSDRKFSLILLLLCAILWFFVIPYQVPGSEQSMVPRIVTLWIAFFSVLLLTKDYFKKDDVEQDDPRSSDERKPLTRVVLVSIIFGIYVFSIDFLGFFISTPPALASLMLCLGVRKWKMLLSFPVLVPLALYLFFEMGLRLQLPRGSIFQ